MTVPRSDCAAFNRYIPDENCSGARNAYTITMGYCSILGFRVLDVRVLKRARDYHVTDKPKMRALMLNPCGV